jgi:Tfp pilus assembly protein PilO
MTTAELTANIKKHPFGFLCGAVAIVCAGLIYYRSGAIAELETEYETKSTQAAKMVANVRNAERLPEQLEEIKALTAELESRLINPAGLAVNLQYFYRLEAETGVKIDLRPGVAAKSKTATLYSRNPYSVTVQGSFTQVMTFLRKLEAGRHFVRFTNVNFSKSGSNTEVLSMAVDSDRMSVAINLELLGTL